MNNPKMNFKRSLLLQCFLACFVLTMTRSYDFTNLVNQQRQIPLPPPSSASSPTPKTSNSNETTLVDHDQTVIPEQTPISWFFSKLYGNRQEEETSIRETKTLFNLTESKQTRGGGGGGRGEGGGNVTKLIEEIQDESVKYNVSFLGLIDPFYHYSTKLSYDYTIDVGEPRNNGKGSIVSLLNGTIFPLGSVGAMSALGWRGGKNETVKYKSKDVKPALLAANLTFTNSTNSNFTQSNANNTSNKNNTATPPIMSEDGLSGIWLAFTSQHALTGGYTLHSKQLSISNNAIFHNVTFRSNFTIDSHGQFNFTFTFGVVDESDQYILMKKSNSTSNNGNSKMQQDEPVINPIRLEGPQCIQVRGTNNSETGFMLQCRGKKIHLFDDI